MKKQTHKFCIFLLATFIFNFPTAVNAEVVGIDPFESIEHFKLKNGMGVYLAPSEETNLTSIRVEVDVGWEAETKENWGVSHLLEHVLFRDKELREEMSYLQLIKEAGGSANGTTQKRMTSYFGTIPNAKGAWLLENFSKMLLVQKIENDYVRKEKSTVELEIGQPGPLTQILGFHPIEILKPSYLKPDGFWKKEFGKNYDDKFTVTEEQLSNRRLTTQQVWDHYIKFYHPTNMRIYVAGKFNREEILSIIGNTFAKLSPRGGLKLIKESKSIMSDRPYMIESLGQDMSFVSLGTKANNLSIKESDVLSSYTNYLAHKLMKEVRNKKGQTYTARSDDYIYGYYGYTAVSFQTPKEYLDENYKIAKGLIERQAEKGQMTKDEVTEAINLALSEYHLKGREVEQLMDNAITYQSIQENYGQFSSPYKLLKETSVNEYNSILKKYFVPKNRYQVINRAPYFFAYDYIVFCGIVAVLTFTFLRRAITKEFKNDRIRWVRKIKYPPLKMLEGTVLVAGVVFFVHACFAINLVWENLPFLEAHLFTKFYFSAFLTVSLLIVSLLIPLCAFPKKLMVVEDNLVMKSVTYYSRKIPLNEIASIEKSKSMTYPFPLSKWIMKVGFRYHFYNLKFWKDGVLINLKNGKSYFFSTDSADQVIAELSQFVPTEEKEREFEMAA